MLSPSTYSVRRSCNTSWATRCVLTLVLVASLFLAPGALAQAEAVRTASGSMDHQGAWTRDRFESLFPQPPPGWGVSEVKVQELKTFAQVSGLEGMENMARGISGMGAQDPSVRYRLVRVYRDSRDSTHTLEVVIDSEDIEAASLVLVAHGYSRIEDGKPVPLADDQKPLQAQLLDRGVTPFKEADHLGIYATQEGAVFMGILAGATGVMGLACEYAGCFDDLDVLAKRTSFSLFDEFARFDHRKPNPKKMQDPMTTTAPWRLVYHDGSGNGYRFEQEANGDARFAYTPVRPQTSSSGVYSGGEPKEGRLGDGEVEALWTWVLKLEEDTSVHAESRMMGSGTFSLTTPDGNRTFIIKNGSQLRAFNTFLAPFRDD